MKRHLIPIIALCLSLTAQAKPFASNDIPEDYLNDIWLRTSEYVELQVGSTHTIKARRVPEIIDNAISNTVTLPPFTFEAIEGTSATVDAESGLVTATALGRTLIEVGYKAVEANGITYAAVSPVNKAYVVVNVVDSTVEHGIEISTTIKATSYDTYYFDNQRGFDLTFDATATADATVKVYCNGTELTADNDGHYTACLVNRTNVIEVEATNATGSKRWAKTVDARRAKINVENKSKPGFAVTEGDTVHVSFSGITLPVYKLATIYNPCMNSWGEESPKVRYYNTKLDSVKTNVNVTQWELATNNTIEMKMPEAGEYNFRDGFIRESWWGKPLGNDKEAEANEPGLGSPTQYGSFSKLPAFRIHVQPKAVELVEKQSLDTLMANRLTDANGEMTMGADSVWSNTYSEAEEHSVLMDGYFVASHLPSGASYEGTSWEGFTVSRQQEGSYANGTMARQFSNNAAGGVRNADDAYLVGYYSEYFDGLGSGHSCQIDFGTTDKCQPQGVYVSLNNWPTHNIVFGDAFARKFVKGDYFTLTAHGLDAEGNDNGRSVTHYLADYRSDSAENRYVQQGWEWMNLSGLGEASGIYFTLESTDRGDWGMNTSAYFALDELVVLSTESEGTGIGDEFAERLKVYPNPAHDVVFVEGTDERVALIYNVQGQLVARRDIVGKRLYVGDLSEGVYVIRMGDKAVRIIKR